MENQDIIEEFREAMARHGIVTEEPIIADGELHRFHIVGDKANTKNGWFILHANDGGPAAGVFGSWKHGLRLTWRSKNGVGAGDPDFKRKIALAEAQRAEWQEKLRARSRRKAERIWNAAQPAPGEHPYLKLKGVRPLGTRIYRESLVVPLLDVKGDLQSLQFIPTTSGEGKRFLSGGRTGGCFFMLGSPGPKTTTLNIGEGFATCATVFEATQNPTVVAFNAQNLLPVCEAIRAKYPGVKLVVCGDDDAWTQGNPGMTKATAAAEAVGARLAVPKFKDTAAKPTDFNDLARLEGMATVRMQLTLAEAAPALEKPDPGIEQIRQRWASAEQPERDRLLMEAMGSLSGCPALERERRMEELMDLTKLSRRVLDGAARDHKDIVLRKAQEPPPPRKGGLPRIKYVVNHDQINELFDRIVDALLPRKTVFSHHDELVMVRPGVGPILLTPRNLSGLLSSEFEIMYLAKSKLGEAFQRFGVIQRDHVAPFLSSPRVIARFPVLKQYTRSPVFDLSWNLIAEPGYHEESGIYYDGPEISPKEGVERLKEVLGGFCWKSQADYVNYVGMLLTGLTMSHWPGRHPMIVFNGNKPGVGKSLLGSILSLILDGAFPKTLSFSPNDEELEKGLATRVDLGDRAIVIDNAKRTARVREVGSQTLERSITSEHLNFRRLGGNTAISKTNDVIFALTMNFTQLSRDLRRRSLPVNLETDENVRTRKFATPDLAEHVRACRVEILAELAGMVQRWRSAGPIEIEDPAEHSVGPVWAQTIDQILRYSGFNEFLANFADSEHAFDQDYELMVEICAAHHDQPPATPSEWAEILGDNIMETRFLARNGRPKTKRAQATIIGTLFGNYLDTTIKLDSGQYRTAVQDHGIGHSKTYWFIPDEASG